MQAAKTNKNPKEAVGSSSSAWSKLACQVISVSVFLSSWVINGELLQGISNGSVILGGANDRDDSISQGQMAYNKPVFVTWCSYNFMMLGMIWVLWYCRRRQLRRQQQRRSTSTTFGAILHHYICHVWTGRRQNLCGCLLACTVIGYMLQGLNIFMMLGLDCISVSLSNGIYQIQTMFTLGLSVLVLKDRLTWGEGLGIIVSMGGIVLLVVPPIWLLQESQASKSNTIATNTPTCPWHDTPRQSLLAGIVATLSSAAIGGFYLVSWRIFDEWRGKSSNNSTVTSSMDDDDVEVGLGEGDDSQEKVLSSSSALLEGLIDTQMTLAAMGFCNFLMGWPLIVIAHVIGWEEWQMPTTQQARWLLINGLVEYIFDGSCAIAIFQTSPMIVAVVSPLTAPMSNIADQFFWGRPPGQLEKTTTLLRSLEYNRQIVELASFAGAAVTMAGVYLMETRPNGIGKASCSGKCSCRFWRQIFSICRFRRRQRRQTDFEA